MKNALPVIALITFGTFPSSASANETWEGPYVGTFVDINSSEAVFEDYGCWASCTQPQLQSTSALAGLAIGYDIQPSENIVVGFVGDIASGSTNKLSTEDLPGMTTIGSIAWRSKVNWQATARMRVGLAQGDSLVYLTGGVAMEKDTTSVVARDIPPWFPGHSANYDATWSGHRNGLVYGAGFEHRMGHISLKAELLHSKYSIKSACFSNSYGVNQGACWNDNTSVPALIRTGRSSNAIRLGVNLRF
jgi:Outer membrane protein beta-barrel domain